MCWFFINEMVSSKAFTCTVFVIFRSSKLVILVYQGCTSLVMHEIVFHNKLILWWAISQAFNNCLICSECYSSCRYSSNTSLQVFSSGWQAFSVHWRWSLLWSRSYCCILCCVQELSFWLVSFTHCTGVAKSIKVAP